MLNALRKMTCIASGALAFVLVSALPLAAEDSAARDDRLAYAATNQQPSDPTAAAIKGLIDDAKWQPGRVAIDWQRLRSFYSRSDFQPAWNNPNDAAQARDTLQKAPSEGLVAADYAADAIESPQDDDPARRARYDILLTNSLLLYARDVRQGRLAPDEVYGDAEFRSQGYDDPAELQSALQNGTLDQYFQSLPPQQDGYRALRKLLARYRASRPRPSATISKRVAIIEANMERWRWLPKHFEQRYIEVNVPAAELNVLDSGQVLLNSRVVVGRQTDPTPMLRAEANAITINPVWNIPQGIARKEIIPKLRHNRSYLRKQDIKIVDRATMQLKQLPGPKNALGAIKVEMPNRFNVYLHDTPGQSAFAKNMRDESHGCMRVQQILPLTSIALTGDPNAAVEYLTNAIQTGKTQKIALPQPLPVYVVYFTVTIDQGGSPHFWPDIYGRDQQLISELQKRNVAERYSVL